MFSTIYILKYNNYYNRQVKQPMNTVAEYEPYMTQIINQVNFDVRDGVSTEIITISQIDSGDYIVVANGTSVESRWYIIDSSKICEGQNSGMFRTILRRDVIADNFDSVVNATSFIRKGTVADDDPLIYTQEPIATNQIKTKEIELKDDTNSAWIVGYIARNTSYKGTDKDNPHRMTISSTVILPDETATSLTNWRFNKYVDKYVVGTAPNKPTLAFFVQDYNKTSYAYKDFIYNMTMTAANPGKAQSGYRFGNSSGNPFEKYLKAQKSAAMEKVYEYANQYSNFVINYTDYLDVVNLDGKILQAGTDYYKIKAAVGNYTDTVSIINDVETPYLRNYLNGILRNAPDLVENNPAIVPMELSWTGIQGCKLTLEKIDYGDYYVDFPEEAERYHLKDAPYDMFAIPYADDLRVYQAGGGAQGAFTTANKTLCLAIAQDMARQLDAQLYDLQLLPYCPFGGYTMSGARMQLLDTSTKRRSIIYKSDETPTTSIIWCTASSGTKNVTLKTPLTIGNKKMNNQCDTYRLVSPNYNGQFEFNLAKNNIDNLSVFTVDFTYMPYNPYIHVAPQFGGLYGENYGDARGLICGGDFSLARISDAWQNYQLQNKNYQTMFDRQIQNMDVNRKFQAVEEHVGAVVGSFQTSAQAFAMGGGAIGAVIGGVAGLTAGAIDIGMSRAKYDESKSYATDVHKMQLDNIRALPYSVSKTSAFTANNKVFVILEYYTATDREKSAIALEIANKGMTVAVIGQISHYLNNDWSYEDITDRGYIEATPIKIDIEGDLHVANAISEELQKGVYFK